MAAIVVAPASATTKKVLTTEHKDYVVNARQSKEARAIIPRATIALTSSQSRDTPRRPVTPHSPSFLFLAIARQVGSGQRGSARFLSRDNCVTVKVSTCQVEPTQVTSHYLR